MLPPPGHKAVDPGNTPSGPGETLLGEELSNPYDLANINEAYTLLYGQPGSLSATHYYLKLLPSTGEHIVAIEEYEEVNGYEFELQPIHFEVAYEGDEGYQGPSNSTDDFAPEYGAVSADDFVNGNLPENVPYEVIHVMHIPLYESRLTYTAFVLSDNEKYYEAIDGYCHPDCPTWPSCLDDPVIACVPTAPEEEIPTLDPYSEEPRENFPSYLLDNGLGYNGEVEAKISRPDKRISVDGSYITSALTPEEPAGIPEPVDLDCPAGCIQELVPLEPEPPFINWAWVCTCDPPDGDGGGDPEPPAGQEEQCGCFVFEDDRKPGGVIQVFDTQLGEEGVRRVKVKTTKHHWGFIWRNTDTDDDGCWRINKRYNVKRMKTKVVFKDRVSDRMVIRSFRGVRFWNAFLKPVKNTWRIRRNNRNWNSLCLTIFDEAADDNQTSKRKQTFVAATTNNAVHEFYDDFGINLPGAQAGNGKLAILINTFGNNANAAPMFREMDQEQFGVSDLLHYASALSIATSPGLPFYLIVHNWWEVSKFDMMVSFGTNRPSDRHKAIVYHELTHVAQYTRVGSPWWKANILYLGQVALSNQPRPYGLGTLPGAGRTELIEGMAESVGLFLADQRYGLQHSNGVVNPQLSRWINRAERLIFWPDAAEEGVDFIPEGLFFDLFDGPNVTPDVTLPEPNNFFGPIVITDNVQGISFEQQLDGFDPGVMNIPLFRDRLFQLHGMSTGNTLLDYNQLFQSYGF